MQLSYIHIENFKYIKELTIEEIDEVLILVGKNNTGKTTVLDALRLVTGDYEVKETDFMQPGHNIIVKLALDITEDDLQYLYTNGFVSKFKRYDTWYRDFCNKLPSYAEDRLEFTCIISPKEIRYFDGVKKNNPYIKAVLPRIYYISHERDIRHIEENVLHLYDNQFLGELKSSKCIFDRTRGCNQCFQCIGMINKKMPQDLTAVETRKLLEYKILDSRLNELSDQVTKHFHENGSASRDIQYKVDFDINQAITINTNVYNQDRNTTAPIGVLSEGLKSIYLLSLLEAYIDVDNSSPCIIMIEDPELYLHPQLQKVAGEILFRLSKKNQVMFSTHSPTMISNFSSRQIKQVVLDRDYNTTVIENVDVDDILDDLGYTASDIMNVSFVFIVEGKQDSNRLPMLLEKYYKEVYDEDGKLQRISIIPTNSCTNIKTYANLKYMNKIYLKDQFLMIRDSDGKNPKYLVKQLCSYYGKRQSEEMGGLPRVTPKNVLILKYYSFENYFLDPKIMARIGVIKNEQEFYNILYSKYKDYLFKLPSMKRMSKALNVQIRSKEDLKAHIEDIKVYVRGHNLFDIFYGKYRKDAEDEILRKYVEIAPRECFADILNAIDQFIYFQNRRKDEK